MLTEIRTAQMKDIDEMTSLIEELFGVEADFDFDALKVKKALEMMIPESDDRAVIVANHGGTIIGMCSIQTLISTAEGGKAGIIEDVVVTSKFRRKGIAAMLLDEVQKWAVHKGIRRLQLLADIENETALDFYKANNWSKTKLICLRKYVEDM